MRLIDVDEFVRIMQNKADFTWKDTILAMPMIVLEDKNTSEENGEEDELMAKMREFARLYQEWEFDA